MSVDTVICHDVPVETQSLAEINQRGYGVTVSIAGFEPADLGSTPGTLASHAHAWACDCSGEHLGSRTPRPGFDSRHTPHPEKNKSKKEVNK